jgi:hypothetical protein
MTYKNRFYFKYINVSTNNTSSWSESSRKQILFDETTLKIEKSPTNQPFPKEKQGVFE